MGTGNPVYGHAFSRQPSVEVILGNMKGGDVTLNLLCGLEGVLYANNVDGVSDSICFLNFFGEAGQATTNHGNQAIEVDHFIVMDNCATHRYEAGDILQRWLLQMGNLFFGAKSAVDSDFSQFSCFFDSALVLFAVFSLISRRFAEIISTSISSSNE